MRKSSEVQAILLFSCRIFRRSTVCYQFSHSSVYLLYTTILFGIGESFVCCLLDLSFCLFMHCGYMLHASIIPRLLQIFNIVRTIHYSPWCNIENWRKPACMVNTVVRLCHVFSHFLLFFSLFVARFLSIETCTILFNISRIP